MRPLPRSLLRPIYRPTLLEPFTSPILASFDVTRVSLYGEIPSPHLAVALLAITVRGCIDTAVPGRSPSRGKVRVTDSDEVNNLLAFLLDCNTLAWFPNRTMALGSGFRPALVSSFRQWAGGIPEKAFADPAFTLTFSFSQALEWLSEVVKLTRGRYEWLVTTLLRVNFVDALARSSLHTNERMHEFQQFVDCHLPLISFYQSASFILRGSERLQLAAYGAKDARSASLTEDDHDPGCDSTLEMLYNHARIQAFYDPSCAEFGCSVLDRLKPSERHTECFENLPNITAAMMQSSWECDSRSRLPLAHLITKPGNKKCAIRSFPNIGVEHCRRSPAICSYMRRMTYVGMTGSLSVANRRPEFGARLELFTELIAPDDHTANLNFLHKWWTGKHVVIYTSFAENITAMLQRLPALYDLFRDDPSRVNIDAASVSAMDLVRICVDRVPSSMVCFEHTLVSMGCTVEDFITGRVYRPMIPHLVWEPEGVMNNIAACEDVWNTRINSTSGGKRRELVRQRDRDLRLQKIENKKRRAAQENAALVKVISKEVSAEIPDSEECERCLSLHGKTITRPSAMLNDEDCGNCHGDQDVACECRSCDFCLRKEVCEGCGVCFLCHHCEVCDMCILCHHGEKEKNPGRPSGDKECGWDNHAKPELTLMEDEEIDKQPELSLVRDMLSGLAEHEIFDRSTRMHENAMKQMMMTIAHNYGESHKANLEWMRKLRKEQCLDVIFSVMNRTYETFWREVQTSPHRDAFRYPWNWKEREKTIVEWFARADPWKLRETYRWENLREVGVSDEAITDLVACEDLFHRPEPESRIFVKFVEILCRSFEDFVVVFSFLTKLSAQIQVSAYDLPLNMREAQKRALKVFYGACNSPDYALSPYAGLIYICPSCDKIRTPVAGSVSYNIRHGILGIPRANIDFTTGTCYCNRTYESSYSAGPSGNSATSDKEDNDVLVYLSHALHRYAFSKPCDKTPLVPVNLLGKIIIYNRKMYTLCMRCGSPAIFDIALFEGADFCCGFCEDFCHQVAATNDEYYEMISRGYAAERDAYAAIKTDPAAYLQVKEWPLSFTPEARAETLVELEIMELPLVARQKKEIDVARGQQDALQRDISDKRCRWCIDERWQMMEMHAWATSSFDESRLKGIHSNPVVPSKFTYYIYDDLNPDEGGKRVRCFYLCTDHAMRRRHFAASPYIKLSQFVPQLREDIKEREWKKFGSTTVTVSKTNAEEKWGKKKHYVPPDPNKR